MKTILWFFAGLILLTSLAAPASAQWSRQVLGGNGTHIDSPPPHPLKYFTDDPYVLDLGRDLCIICTVDGRKESARRDIVESDVSPVGTIAGLKIVDVFYRIGLREEGKPANVRWKSILIQTGPDQYREIFHLQMWDASVEPAPSGIVQVGNQLVLSTTNSDGGNGGGCIEDFWLVNSSGVREIDFSALSPAIRARVPTGATYRTDCYTLSIGDQLVHTPVQKADPECRICGYIGFADAHFRLDGARAVPTDVEFIPDPPK